MAYTKNPHLPRIRREAAHLVLYHGWSTRKVARHTGFNQSSIVRWARKAKTHGYNAIPTRSSKPKRHPKQLTPDVVRKIVEKRHDLKRSAEVIHLALKEDGVIVSLSSVKRTLDRKGLLKKRWKKSGRISPARPNAEKPGDLVQVDTIHLLRRDGTRIYVFTGLDVRTRFAHAWACEKASGRTALQFLKRMKSKVPFTIRMLQSDHGPEFSRLFRERAQVEHRHSRVRRPNDNAHLERFNRTIQDELIRSLPKETKVINKKLPKWLRYYNKKRHHFGLNLLTPLKVMQSY
ncbi:MAG TPA: integrase core domain-containing protein [Candidatus Paceibacterota bacterium]|jgi:transposase InsO family protein|nr:integrase core domain-containing protein [Candidatus Paceibacterota bacterium]